MTKGCGIMAGRTIGYSACGGLLVLWAATALAATSPESPSAPVTDECPATVVCIDQYLWSVYQRTPKTDAVKVSEKRKVKVKRKGRTRTVVTTVTRLVEENFTWKDLKAAEKAGHSPIDYVIGGMDPGFKLTLYHALHALDDAGLAPGITSAFRDDYRQGIATGNKAQVDRSYHGGSTRGGYGHGLAADLVSVKGATRAERCRSSQELWTWIDAHGRDFGIGRPYLDRDAPHVAPIDGKEYADHRGTARHAEAAAPPYHRQARNHVHRTRHASRMASAKPGSGHGRVHHSAASARGRVHKSTT